MTKPVRLEGIEAITKKINGAVAEMKHRSSRGLAAAAIYIANEAVKRAPIETGDLKNSVYIDLDGKRVASGTAQVSGLNPNISGDEKIADVGFASQIPENNRYIIKQHEDLSLVHDRDPATYGYRVPTVNERTGKPNKTAGKTYNMVPGGQAKYLESVLVEEQDRILRLIAGEAGGGDD